MKTISVSLGDILKRFTPEKFVDLSAAISETIERYSQNPEDPLVAGRAAQLAALELIRVELESVGLIVSLKKLASIRKKAEDEKAQTQGEVKSDFEDLRSRIEDELETIVFLHLSSEEAVLYRRSEEYPMGELVDQRFPSAKYDIEEAYKCLALGRATAAAFHGMRVLEYGIRAIAKCLAIPDPVNPNGRNWGTVLQTIKAKLDERWPRPANRQSGDGHIFDGLYASLDAVKNPWRNATMHVEAIYTEENARHIIDAVAAFMRILADRADESGSPEA